MPTQIRVMGNQCAMPPEPVPISNSRRGCLREDSARRRANFSALQARDGRLSTACGWRVSLCIADSVFPHRAHLCQQGSEDARILGGGVLGVAPGYGDPLQRLFGVAHAADIAAETVQFFRQRIGLGSPVFRAGVCAKGGGGQRMAGLVRAVTTGLEQLRACLPCAGREPAMRTARRRGLYLSSMCRCHWTIHASPTRPMLRSLHSG